MAASHGSVRSFDSKREDRTSYTERLNYYFIANDIASDEKKHSILLSKCGPAAYKLIKSLVDKDELVMISHANLVKAVQDHSEPKPSVIVERYKFNSRTQAAGESIASFVAALRHLARYCDYRETLNDMLRDRLVLWGQQ